MKELSIMDNFVMIRSFDHAGYYETRLILMILALSIALFFAFKKKDTNYIVIFLSSAFFFGIVELILYVLGMRTELFTISVFGLEIPTNIMWIFQGFTEGGIHGVMGFLLLDMYTKRSIEDEFKFLRNLFLGMLIIIVIFAIIVGLVARNQPITSIRPMFGLVNFLYLTGVIIIALILAKIFGGEGIFKYLGIYLLGTLIYVILNLEIMHILGARYIGIEQANGVIVTADPFYQVLIMLYSDIYEVTVSRSHYLIIPLILGLIKLK
jgi:hypothetical protein